MDSLITENPDSALAELQRIHPAKTDNKGIRMKYILLLSMAEDRCYKPRSQDSLISKAIRYYEDQSSPQLLQMAYYLQGRIYTDLGDDSEAMKYFYKALDLKYKPINNNALGRIYSQLGYIFITQRLYQESLNAYKKAFSYYQKERNTKIYAKALLDIGWGLIGMERYEEGENYFQKSYAYALKNQDEQTIARILHARIEAFLFCNDLKNTERVLLQSNHILKERNMEASFYITWADYYNKINQPDSATKYNNKAIDEGNLYTANRASYNLFIIYSEQKKYEKAIRMANQFIIGKDSIDEQVNMQALKRIQAVYDYTKIEKERNVLTIKNKERLSMIYLVVGLSMILLLSAYFVYFCYRKKRDYELLQNRQLLTLEKMRGKQIYNQMQNLIAEKDKLQEQISQLKKEDKEFTKLKEEKDYLEAELLGVQSQYDTMKLMESKFLLSPIYQYIHKEPEETLKLKTEDWKEIKRWLDAAYNNFTTRLFVYWPRLSESEFHLCCLVKMAVPVKRIAVIEHKAPNSISSARNRLMKKVSVHLEEGISLDIFLADL